MLTSAIQIGAGVISDYNTLVASKTTAGSLANWTNKGDLPTSEILTEAQALIFQRMRVREMTSAPTAFTFLNNTSSTALPADCLDPIQFLPYQWWEPLPLVHEDWLRAPRDSSGNLFSGSPSYWSIIGTTAYVDVLCNADFPGVLLYYQLPTALSVGNPTNWLTVRYPTLLRHMCMALAYQHMKDTQRAQEYLQLASLDIAEAMRTNDMFRRGSYSPMPGI